MLGYQINLLLALNYKRRNFRLACK